MLYQTFLAMRWLNVQTLYIAGLDTFKLLKVLPNRKLHMPHCAPRIILGNYNLYRLKQLPCKVLLDLASVVISYPKLASQHEPTGCTTTCCRGNAIGHKRLMPE